MIKTKQILAAVSALALLFTVQAQASSGSITVPTPSSSNIQTWTNGGWQNIQWTVPSSNASSSTSISLIPYSTNNCMVSGSSTTCTTSSPYIIANNIANNGTYSASVGKDVNGNAIPTGQYLVNIYDNSGTNLSPTGNSSQIISLATNNFQLTPSSGPTGTTVTLTGAGLSSSTTPVIQFGNGNYISASSSSSSTIQFMVPSFSQPCSTATNPATSANMATSTAAGSCGIAATSTAAGTYNVTFTSNGSQFTLPFTVTNGGVNVPATPFADGSVIQPTGRLTVYLVKNGMYIPFTSAQIFLGRGYQWNQVQSVDPSQVNAQLISMTPVAPQDGAIIKTAQNPTIYIMVSGQKSGIPSMDVFNRLGLNLNNLVIVSDQDMQSFPTTTIQS